MTQLGNTIEKYRLFLLATFFLFSIFHVCYPQTKGFKRDIDIKITDKCIYLDTMAKSVKINYRVFNHSKSKLRFYAFVDQYWWNETENLPNEYQTSSMGVHPFFEDSGYINRPFPRLYQWDVENEHLHPESRFDSVYFRYIRKGFVNNEIVIAPNDSADFYLEYELKNSFREYTFYPTYLYNVYIRYVMREEIYYRLPQLLDVDKPKIFFGDITSNKVDVILVGKKTSSVNSIKPR